jgi:hypothetical protein
VCGADARERVVCQSILPLKVAVRLV